jgi:hypothetical protein
MISNKRAIEAAKTTAEYCGEQNGCQNCIFRLYGCENWHCAIGAFDIRDVLSNAEAKKKNHGHID